MATILTLGCISVVNAQQIDTTEGSPADTSAIDLEVAAGEEDVDSITPPDRPRRLTWTTSTRYNLERKAGYKASDSTAFHGPPVAFRSRLRWRLGTHLKMVAVVDHDAGEGVGSAAEALDFVTASITLSKIGPINSLVGGALRPRLGMGLTVWSGQRLVRLGLNPGSFMRPGASVRASGSSYEATVFKGAGVDLSVRGPLRLVMFAAAMTQDAIIDESGEVGSRPTTGLHRNDREIARDDRLGGRLIGVSILLDSKSAGIGFSFASGFLNPPISQGVRPYQVHAFTGRSWRTTSLEMHTSPSKRLNLAGEMAIDGDGTPAAILVVRTKAAPGLWIHFAWRDYPPDFSGMYGAAPGAAGSTSGNERGWMIGVEGRWARSHLRLFHDLYRKPWLQFDSYRPSTFVSSGMEYDGRFGSVRFVLRLDEKVANRELVSAVLPAAPFEHRHRLRIRLEAEGNRRLRPSFDVVFVHLRDSEVETGEGIGQRLVWLASRRLTVTSGVVFFKSDSGDSGIYLYEPDLPGYFAVPLLSDSGERAYVLVAARISPNLTCWIKGTLARYEEERTIGSGVDRLTARQLRSVAFAIRFGL